MKTHTVTLLISYNHTSILSLKRPCFSILEEAFPGRLQLVPGRSQQTLCRWARENQLRADLIHIDGDHDPEETQHSSDFGESTSFQF